MAATKWSDEALLAFLKSHPDLRDRMASIADAVENAEGNLEEADAAEERLVEEMRLLGREAARLGGRAGRGYGTRSSASGRDASPR
jgi:hypothetical protein